MNEKTERIEKEEKDQERERESMEKRANDEMEQVRDYGKRR